MDSYAVFRLGEVRVGLSGRGVYSFEKVPMRGGPSLKLGCDGACAGCTTTDEFAQGVDEADVVGGRGGDTGRDAKTDARDLDFAAPAKTGAWMHLAGMDSHEIESVRLRRGNVCDVRRSSAGRRAFNAQHSLSAMMRLWRRGCPFGLVDPRVRGPVGRPMERLEASGIVGEEARRCSLPL